MGWALMIELAFFTICREIVRGLECGRTQDAGGSVLRVGMDSPNSLIRERLPDWLSDSIADQLPALTALALQTG